MCCSYTEPEEHPSADPSCTAPQVTYCASDTVFMRRRAVTGAPHRFRPIVVEGLCRETCHYVGYAFSSTLSQGAGGVQEVLDRHPEGFSYSPGCLRHLSHGFKGARRIFFTGVSLPV